MRLCRALLQWYTTSRFHPVALVMIIVPLCWLGFPYPADTHIGVPCVHSFYLLPRANANFRVKRVSRMEGCRVYRVVKFGEPVQLAADQLNRWAPNSPLHCDLRAVLPSQCQILIIICPP